MMRPGDDVPIYLCREAVDMRKSINRLAVLVEQGLALDPFARAVALFVFCNRKRDKVKILYWERTGFVLSITSRPRPERSAAHR